MKKTLILAILAIIVSCGIVSYVANPLIRYTSSAAFVVADDSSNSNSSGKDTPPPNGNPTDTGHGHGGSSNG